MGESRRPGSCTDFWGALSSLSGPRKMGQSRKPGSCSPSDMRLTAANAGRAIGTHARAHECAGTFQRFAAVSIDLPWSLPPAPIRHGTASNDKPLSLAAYDRRHCPLRLLQCTSTPCLTLRNATSRAVCVDGRRGCSEHAAQIPTGRPVQCVAYIRNAAQVCALRC